MFLMKKWIVLIIFLSAACVLRAGEGADASPDDQSAGATQSFEGVVTALGPNADDPDHTFTAISDDGLAKVFRISSLKNLDLGDRVTLKYLEGDTYPQTVQTIAFHQPR